MKSCAVRLVSGQPPVPSPLSYTPKHLADKILTSRSALEGDAARDLLAAVYAWFSEGFATRGLVNAKALLAELGGNPVSTRRDVP